MIKNKESGKIDLIKGEDLKRNKKNLKIKMYYIFSMVKNISSTKLYL